MSFAVSPRVYTHLIEVDNVKARHLCLPQNSPWCAQDTQYVHRTPHEIRNAFNQDVVH